MEMFHIYVLKYKYGSLPFTINLKIFEFYAYYKLQIMTRKVFSWNWKKYYKGAYSQSGYSFLDTRFKDFVFAIFQI
jgi:hypothetical protein